MAKPIQKKNFWQALHANRILIILIAFFIVLPIALVIGIYIGSYTSGRKIHFDATQTAETEFISYHRFTDPDALDALNLTIEWRKLQLPKPDDDNELVDGYYEFSFATEAKSGYDLSDITITPVLHIAWTNKRALGATVNLSVTSTSRINFNYRMPVRPLWFIQVSDPTLYLKISYVHTSSLGYPTQSTVYVKYALNNINPLEVVDPNME